MARDPKKDGVSETGTSKMLNFFNLGIDDGMPSIGGPEQAPSKPWPLPADPRRKYKTIPGNRRRKPTLGG